MKMCLYLTCVSAPNKMTMMKKHMDHICGKGIIATARGYAINANPGPVLRTCR